MLVDCQTPRCTHLIFLDLELTSGFYEFESEPKILEVAVIVTDKDMTELDRGHWVLGGFTREDLEALGDFHKARSTRSFALHQHVTYIYMHAYMYII